MLATNVFNHTMHKFQSETQGRAHEVDTNSILLLGLATDMRHQKRRLDDSVLP